MATLTDIAERAGVSFNTASRILNQGYVGTRSDAVRRAERVRLVAKEMGYRPNTMARAMRSGRFDAVGLLQGTPNASHWLPLSTQNAIRRELDGDNMSLTMDALTLEHEQTPRILREGCVDGLLVTALGETAQRLRPHVERANLPAVWLNQKFDWDCVYPDDVQGARLATEHLLKLGHTRVAFVQRHLNPLPDHYSFKDRPLGYSLAMEAAGLASQILPAEGKTDPAESLQALTMRWLDRADRPTAVVTYESDIATTVCGAAYRIGLRVPEDLSIVGISELPIDSLGIRITTCRIPGHELGLAAVRMLREKMKTGESVKAMALGDYIWSEGITTAPPT